MSKYVRLWKYIADSGQDQLTIPFSAVERITDVPLDHFFLACVNCCLMVIRSITSF